MQLTGLNVFIQRDPEAWESKLFFNISQKLPFGFGSYFHRLLKLVVGINYAVNRT